MAKVIGVVRIIGFDPGLSRTGWGVIVVEGVKLSHVANGVVTTRAIQQATFTRTSPLRRIR